MINNANLSEKELQQLLTAGLAGGIEKLLVDHFNSVLAAQLETINLTAKEQIKHQVNKIMSAFISSRVELHHSALEDKYLINIQFTEEIKRVLHRD